MNNEQKIFTRFSESTFMYFQEPFVNLNIRKFKIELEDKPNRFDVLFAYSYDNQNFTFFKSQENYEDKIIDDSLSIYVCIWFKERKDTDLIIPTNLYDKAATEDKYRGNYAKQRNVDASIPDIVVTEVSYNNKQFTIDQVRFKTHFDLVNEFPHWNLYDNQTVTINRWLEQCNAVAEMYGHTVIYFKTEPVDIPTEAQSGIHGRHHVLQNNVIRNVIDIKKLHILLPNNEIPQDRVIYTDWDMPLQDDFVMHIVRQKFEQAFGLKAIPNEKDYIYFPMLNKLFRVSTMQPKNGFMGVCGWYEVFLAKYEQDDCVRFDSDIKQALSGMVTGEQSDNILSELEDMVADELYSAEYVNQKVTEEEKQATEQYTNALEDTTLYVSLKETEKLREFYNKRLEIASINPDDGLFPITMYDCKSIGRREIAMRYNLLDYSVVNKFSNVAKEKYSITFDIVITNRFNGEIFDILCGNNSVCTIAMHSNKIQIFDTKNQTDYVISQKLDKLELYQINIEFNLILKTYSFKVFKLENKQKSLLYQDVYKIESVNKQLELTNLNLYGGNYMIGNINFDIDGKKFIDDKCLPLLNQYKF